MYSELNFLWECLVESIITNNKDEAIVNKSSKKRLR